MIYTKVAQKFRTVDAKSETLLRAESNFRLEPPPLAVHLNPSLEPVLVVIFNINRIIMSSVVDVESRLADIASSR